MNYRPLPRTELQLSEIGFGLWTVSTGWWGQFTEAEAIALMHRALDLGITLFDAADTYGNGLSEELIAKAFPANRDAVVIATKVGYNFYDHGNERRGQREIPHDFSLPFIRKATELALQRLKTDRIDILQLHNIRMEQAEDGALWALMEDLKKEGKIRSYGAALGPAIGWLHEGLTATQKNKAQKPHILQHIYNLMEPHPGRQLIEESDADLRHLIRVPHSSGMLEGKYTAETVFPPNDHRNHRPRSWLLNGVKKVEQLRFLEGPDRTLGQAALQWLLADLRVGSCLPNIYNEEQLVEFAKTSDTPKLTSDEMAKIASLVAANFGQEEEVKSYKGTMTREPVAAA